MKSSVILKWRTVKNRRLKNSVRGTKITISLDLVTTTKIKNSVRVETLEEIRVFFLSIKGTLSGSDLSEVGQDKKDATPLNGR